MNNKKAKGLKRKAHNLWITFKPDVKKRVTLRRVYQMLKKEYKQI
jgi:hypothetical protein